MISIAWERPFKNRKEVKNIINKCNIAAGFLCILGLIFALVGIIGDALNRELVLESESWLLLAILFMIGSFGPMLNSQLAKHLYGIESENKNK